MVRRISLVVCVIGTLAALPYSGETWTHKGFADLVQGSFEDSGANAYVSVAGRVQMITRLDLNQDGHLDLFVGNGHGHTENEDAVIYFGTGRGIDPRQRAFLPTDSALQALIADLDRDGRNDLVLVNTVGGNLGRTSTYIYYGAPQGFDVAKRRELRAWHARGGAVADWNGDGWLDIAVACANPKVASGAKDLSVIYWNSPQGFDPERKVDLPGLAQSVLASDFDSDGKVDLALALPSEVVIYRGRGAGLDMDRPVRLALNAHRLAAGDLNRDGYPELVALESAGGKSTARKGVSAHSVALLGGGPQGPTAGQVRRIPVINPAEVVVTDLNRDGWPDLAVTSREVMGNEYTNSSVFWNRNGEFSPESSVALPTVNAEGISAGDLNSDGWPDLVISQSGSGDNLNIQSFIYWNREGNFDFARKSMLDTKRARGNAIGDLNHDGAPDVVFCNFEGGLRSGPNPNVIFWGDGTRNYSLSRSSSLWSVYNVGTAQADLDDDGQVDLVSMEARYAHNRPVTLHGAYVWYGDPTGYTEDRRVVLSVEDPRSGVRVADLDRDGYLDLVAGASEKGPDGRIGNVILYGGPGGFSPERRQVIPIGAPGRGPAIADFDRDGFLDMAGGSYDGGVFLVHGSAAGLRLDGMTVLARDRIVLDVEAADFDRDGWLDLVAPGLVPGEEVNELRVYYGSREGFSESRIARLPHLDGHDPCVADFNRDGYLDLFVTNEAGTSCPLYWGGPKGFSRDRFLDVPSGSGAAALAADFDRDGGLDLFLINHKDWGRRDRAGTPVRHNTASFLYWSGTDGFSPARRTEVPTSGPHAQLGRDPGNVYTRELAEVYVSPPFLPAHSSARPERLGWVAQTPGGTAVSLQIRTAATREGLAQAGWSGPSGAASWFTQAGVVPAAAVTGAWFQYRARLSSPDGGSSPILTEVTVQFR